MSRVMGSRLRRRELLRAPLAAGAAVVAAPAVERLANTAVAAQPATPAAGEPDALFAALDDFVAKRMAELKVPGVAVGVIAGDREHAACFGVTNVDHPLPVDADTLFQIGSIGKTYTGTAIMRLVEQGRLDLEAPVRTYLPAFRVADPDASAAVRMRHLVTHTAGWFGDDFTETGDGDDALARYVAGMADLPQIAPVGKYFSYNNAAMCLAGRVIEAVTGQPCEAAIGELVLKPLGLEQTFFFAKEIMTKAFVVGHGAPPDDPNGAPVVREPWALPRATNAAGGEIAGLNDLLRYARFYLGDGTANGTRVLSAESMRRMQTPLGPGGSDGNVRLEGVGVNWLLSSVGGQRIVFHGGSSVGQEAQLVLVPQRRFAFVLLTNAEEGAALGVDATNWALARFLGLTEAAPTAVAVPAARLAEYVGEYDFAEGVAARIERRGDALRLEIPGPNGASPIVDSMLEFVGPDLVTHDYRGITFFADFVRDDAGAIGWIRLSGRLAPRRG